MNHEQQPPEEPDEPNVNSDSQWDANERVGDIYEVEVGEDGTTHIENLRDRPQIWVGSLSDYNNGILYGNWFDAARDPFDVHADIESMLAGSPWASQTGEVAEEWGIFDYEGFGSALVHQHDSIEAVTALARHINKHGLAFAAWASINGSAAAESAGSFDDAYVGLYDTVEDYVHELVDDVGYQRLLDDALPHSLRPYVHIDIAALARDMQLSGDINVVPNNEGGVWIFNNL